MAWLMLEVRMAGHLVDIVSQLASVLTVAKTRSIEENRGGPEVEREDIYVVYVHILMPQGIAHSNHSRKT